MPHQQRAQLLERWQPLPAEGQQPVDEEAVRRALVGVSPELGELFLEQIRLGQAAIEYEQVAERLPLLPVQIGPASQQQPTLTPDEAAGFRPLAEELRAAGLVQG